MKYIFAVPTLILTSLPRAVAVTLYHSTECTSQDISDYKQDFLKCVEKGTNASFSNQAANRWISVRLDISVFMITISTAAFAIAFRNKLKTGLLSFSLQIITEMITVFTFMIRNYIEYKSLLTSPQRILDYINLEEED